MAGSNSDNNSSEKKSTSKLVPLLVIIGIGIPILVELLTLFNLINVQLFRDKSEVQPDTQSVSEVREFSEGDTLFTNYRSPLVIEEMKIEVSAQHWRFTLELIYPEAAGAGTPPQTFVDSLKLRSGKILRGKQTSWKISDDEESELKIDWELPNGDIPAVIFVSSIQPVTADSVHKVQQETNIGNIPVRYTREN